MVSNDQAGIVERLRSTARDGGIDVAGDAADEIERLRAALAELQRYASVCREARPSLKQKMEAMGMDTSHVNGPMKE